jgi:hypothetical protein
LEESIWLVACDIPGGFSPGLFIWHVILVSRPGMVKLVVGI